MPAPDQRAPGARQTRGRERRKRRRRRKEAEEEERRGGREEERRGGGDATTAAPMYLHVPEIDKGLALPPVSENMVAYGRWPSQE